MKISNEGWDAIAISILFLCIAVFLIVGILKTGKWPWQ